jgi:glycerol kinase
MSKFILALDQGTASPFCPDIVWQDRRTAEGRDQLKQQGLTGLI